MDQGAVLLLFDISLGLLQMMRLVLQVDIRFLLKEAEQDHELGAEKGPLAEAHMVMVQLEVLHGEEGQEKSQDMVQVPLGVSY